MTSTNNNCPICFNDIIDNINIVVTECGHKFHISCLLKNISINGFNCPCCRNLMVDNNVENYDIINDNNNIDDYEESDSSYVETLIDDNHIPKIIENIDDLIYIIEKIFDDEIIYLVLFVLKLMDDDLNCNYDELVENHRYITILEIFNVYKRTMLLKKYCNNHIKNIENNNYIFN